LGARHRDWARGIGIGRMEEVPGCAGLKLNMDELWSELDRLGEQEVTEDPLL